MRTVCRSGAFENLFGLSLAARIGIGVGVG
jgi:hypothetical protein